MKMVVFQKNVSLLEVSQLNCENLSWMPIICSPLPMPNRWRLGFLKSWGQTQSSPRVSISFNPHAISTIWGMTKRKKKPWKIPPKLGSSASRIRSSTGAPGGQLQIKKLRNVISEVVCSLVSSGVTRVEAWRIPSGFRGFPWPWGYPQQMDDGTGVPL